MYKQRGKEFGNTAYLDNFYRATLRYEREALLYKMMKIEDIDNTDIEELKRDFDGNLNLIIEELNTFENAMIKNDFSYNLIVSLKLNNKLVRSYFREVINK